MSRGEDISLSGTLKEKEAIFFLMFLKLSRMSSECQRGFPNGERWYAEQRIDSRFPYYLSFLQREPEVPLGFGLRGENNFG